MIPRVLTVLILTLSMTATLVACSGSDTETLPCSEDAPVVPLATADKEHVPLNTAVELSDGVVACVARIQNGPLPSTSDSPGEPGTQVWVSVTNRGDEKQGTVTPDDVTAIGTNSQSEIDDAWTQDMTFDRAWPKTLRAGKTATRVAWLRSPTMAYDTLNVGANRVDSPEYSVSWRGPAQETF